MKHNYDWKPVRVRLMVEWLLGCLENPLMLQRPAPRKPCALSTQLESHTKVERLCDRIATATLLDDRRNAVKALKGMAATHQVRSASTLTPRSRLGRMGWAPW